jgi:single-stranded DNA-specific DHH superfamily exonuclease
LDQKDVIKWIKESNRIVLAFHLDTDGCSSGALIFKLLKKYKKSPILSIPCTPTLPDNVIKKIKDCFPDLIIFVDLSIDQHRDNVLDLAEGTRIAIIDHHQIQNDMNQTNIIHLNSMTKTDTYYPCAKYIYDLFELGDFDWLAAVGVIGDSGIPEWKDFITKVMKKYKLKPEDNPRASLLGKVDEMISAGRILKNSEGALMSYDLLCKSEDLNDFIKKASELEDWRTIVESEIRKLEADFEEFKEEYDDLFYFQIRSKMNISSVMSTILGLKYKDKTIFLSKRKNNMMKIHLRRNDGKLDLGAIVKKTTKKFEHSAAGGHKNAAGGHVLAVDFEDFKDNFLGEYHIIKKNDKSKH